MAETWGSGAWGSGPWGGVGPSPDGEAPATPLRVYQRPLALDHTQPLRGAPLQDIADHCCSVAAFGRHHVSRWCTLDHNAAAAGASAKHFHTRIRPGPNAQTLFISIIAEGASGTAELTWKGTGTATSDTRLVSPGVDGGQVDVSPMSLLEIVYEVDCSAYQDTLWEIWWTCESVHVIRSITLFDSPLTTLPTTASGFADITRHGGGKTLTTYAIGQIAAAQQNIAGALRRSVCNNAPIVDSTKDYLVSMAVDSSWRNAIEGASGTVGWDEDAPGFWYRPSATYGEDPAEKPYLTAYFYAAMSAGPPADAKIKLIHNDGSSDHDSDEITVNTATPTWYSATMELPTPGSFKVQDDTLLQPFVKEGATGGTLEIYACHIEETNRYKTR